MTRPTQEQIDGLKAGVTTPDGSVPGGDGGKVEEPVSLVFVVFAGPVAGAILLSVCTLAWVTAMALVYGLTGHALPDPAPRVAALAFSIPCMTVWIWGSVEWAVAKAKARAAGNEGEAGVNP